MTKKKTTDLRLGTQSSPLVVPGGLGVLLPLVLSKSRDGSKSPPEQTNSAAKKGPKVHRNSRASNQNAKPAPTIRHAPPAFRRTFVRSGK